MSVGGAIATAVTERETYVAESTESLSPVDVRGARVPAGTHEIAWTRRARIDSEWRNNVDVPLDETSEAYELEIYDDLYTTLKRTITGLTSASYSYSAAFFAADFTTAPERIGVKVYQVSDRTGRGRAGSGLVGTILPPSGLVTWNPSDLSGMTLSGGNLTATETSNVQAGVRATYGRNSGKFYFEVEVIAGGGTGDWYAGLANGSVGMNGAVSNVGYRLMYRASPQMWADGTTFSPSGLTALVNGDKVCVAIDFATRNCWMRRNNSAWLGGGDPTAGTSATRTLLGTDVLYPCGHSDNSAGTSTYLLRVKSADLVFTPPTNFNPWET